MTDTQRTLFEASARNLFFTCAGCRPGDHVLLVHETEADGYYHPALVDDLAMAAKRFGFRIRTVEVPFQRSVADPDEQLAAMMARADCTVFLARLGDQIRYRTEHASDRQIVCYALDREMFASDFGACDYRAFEKLRHLLDRSLAQAQNVRVTCPLGTDFSGAPSQCPQNVGDTTRKRFPVSIHAPVPAMSFRGRVVQSGFLTGTGSHFYQPYACTIEDLLTVGFTGNRITSFEGSTRDVDAARRHYDWVGNAFGIDAFHVHSWHAGIHPGLTYRAFAGSSTERWSGGAFGNPRILHIHTCGDYPPGEISLNVIDPTVVIDGVAVWEEGRLFPDRIAGGSALLDTYPDVAEVFETPCQDIGLSKDGRLRMVDATAPPVRPRTAATLQTA